MVSLTGDVPGMLEAIEVTAPQLSLLLQGATNPQTKAIGVWTVGETAAHVVHCYEAFLAMAQGTYGVFPGLDEIGANNARWLAENPERRPNRLADRIEVDATGFATHMRSVEGNPQVSWFGDIKVPVSAMAGVLLAEVLVHGFDIAQTEGLPWSIDPNHAALALEGMFPVLPHFVDQEEASGVETCFDLRMRRDGRSFWTFEDGQLTIEPPSPRRVDCHLSVEPVAFLLVSFNRIQPWGPALSGKFLVWGRKPWMGIRLPKFLKAV